MNNIFLLVLVIVFAFVLCDDDYACPSGYYESGNGECARCTTGHYCDGKDQYRCSADMIAPREGMYICQLCPTPKIADFPRTTCVLGFDPPESCNAGMYVDTENTGVCVTCPAGYYCKGTTGEKVKCTASETEVNEWFSDLPKYYYAASEGSTSCDVCELGTYSSTDGTMCIEMDQSPDIAEGGCRKGYYHNKDIDTCRPCPIGYYCVGYDETANPDQEKVWCDMTDRSYAPERKLTACLECASNQLANVATRFNCIRQPLDLGNATINDTASTTSGRTSMALIIIGAGAVISIISYKIQKKRVMAALEAAMV